MSLIFTQSKLCKTSEKITLSAFLVQIHFPSVIKVTLKLKALFWKAWEIEIFIRKVKISLGVSHHRKLVSVCCTTPV